MINIILVGTYICIGRGRIDKVQLFKLSYYEISCSPYSTICTYLASFYLKIDIYGKLSPNREQFESLLLYNKENNKIVQII